ncbi:acyloxyacyl hydrolase [Pseudopedobacter beijingensis]|uniref:Acyloxyacyl hydrolase n=1 Tax=Pseudopedobacter beijingensis TaxID=1207056 RepID=A0ABW4IC83_9SPHI
MNYSTMKKTVALSLATAFAAVANAQESSSAKVFGGAKQYRTWSIGVNAGVLSPIIPFGTNDYPEWESNLGYGLFVKKQLAPSFGLKLDAHRGKLSGKLNDTPNAPSFETDLNYAAALKGVVNVGTVSFLKRQNTLGFFVQAGAGLTGYDLKNNADNNTGKRTELYIPVGVGANVKLGEVVALNIGYDANFLDADNLDGRWANGASNKDKWSYAYAGLEFTLGSKSKPSLQWSNPVALLYDELKDPALRQEVDALKGRLTNVESSVDALKKDSDGDGVADYFDKCPNTPAGVQVDGSGCPIEFPEPPAVEKEITSDNIQFEFNSSVLRTSAYPTLDRVSADLRANKSKKVQLDGHASSEGTEAYNMQLSIDRANSVKTYLVNSGVDAKRISVKGYGESRPIASNATEEGRILNRRVEFKDK